MSSLIVNPLQDSFEAQNYEENDNIVIKEIESEEEKNKSLNNPMSDDGQESLILNKFMSCTNSDKQQISNQNILLSELQQIGQQYHACQTIVDYETRKSNNSILNPMNSCDELLEESKQYPNNIKQIKQELKTVNLELKSIKISLELEQQQNKLKTKELEQKIKEIEQLQISKESLKQENSKLKTQLSAFSIIISQLENDKLNIIASLKRSKSGCNINAQKCCLQHLKTIPSTEKFPSPNLHIQSLKRIASYSNELPQPFSGKNYSNSTTKQTEQSFNSYSNLLKLLQNNNHNSPSQNQNKNNSKSQRTTLQEIFKKTKAIQLQKVDGFAIPKQVTLS